MKNIPKICHLTWTTNSVMSFLQFLTVISFRKYNPDWKIILHLVKQNRNDLGKNIYVPDFVGEDYFLLIEKLGFVDIHLVDLKQEGIDYQNKATMHISDILRFKYLYEQGGVYSDFDMLWLQPMSNFIDIDCIGNVNNFETTVCYFKGNRGHQNNSNVVSIANGEFLKYILEEQNRLKPPYEHQDFNTTLFNRLFPTLLEMKKLFPDVLAIAYRTFYPYPIDNLKMLYMDDTIKILDKKVMGIHWFNGHKLSQDFLIRRHKCSMRSILLKEDYQIP